MTRETPRQALLAVLVTAIVCSSVVSAAVVMLRPIQLNHLLLDRSRDIMQLTGLLGPGQALEDEQMVRLYRSLDLRLVHIDTAEFDDGHDAVTFDPRRAAADPELGVEVPAEQDVASLGRRSRLAPVYLVWRDDELDRVILPVHGAGMWSVLRGFIALEGDLNTIAGMTFYEQNETPGLGDQVTHQHWLDQWAGRRIFDAEGGIGFRVSAGQVEEGSGAAIHQVDALTGATITGNAVTAMMQYWFGPHGYRDFLAALRDDPPTRPPGGGSDG
ncbi:MAG: NADH:ubiquinone reductase (Na(+)-transporting) subunit C [Gammaproteobacteria bacterium]|nr:NADH:ubiquinone reductase (Na(+)-transporting) subunit C [Gammaproteobacteria bacterium]